MSAGPIRSGELDLTQTVQLLRRAKLGDAQALNDLCARYGERLRTVVRLRLGIRLRSKLESCDVVQDALMKVLPRIQAAEFATSGAFFHWLTAIVENHIRDMADHYAADKRDAARERPLEVQQPGTASVVGPIAGLATTGTPSLAAVRAEDLSRLETAVDALPDEQREALLLVRYEGLTLAEAGAKMNRTPDAVRMLVARALVRLGKTLGAGDT
jgi:RNA polymerase sigma-70 factor (ECF subfamily)